MNNTSMPWIDLLPNVDATNFPDRRAAVVATLRDGQALVIQGRIEEAEAVMVKAYFAVCSLEGEAKKHWGHTAVEEAKARA